MKCFEKYVLEIIVMLNSFFASALIKQIPKQVRKTASTPEKKSRTKVVQAKKNVPGTGIEPARRLTVEGF